MQWTGTISDGRINAATARELRFVLTSAQNDYTRSVLARIPGRDDLFKRIKQLDEGASARVYDIRRLPGGRIFYQKRLASEDMAKLYTRDGMSAPEKLLADPVKITPAGS